MRSPRSVDIEITSRCNLRCLYCYYFDNPAVTYRDLPTEEWLTFFDELGRMAVMDVCLAGGEPFLRSDLKELLAGIVKNRMRFSILSNGSLIDDDIAEFIGSTKRCNHVQVSIDGASSPPHDSCRGTGSFEKAVRGAKTLQRHGVPLGVRLTIHHHNVRELDKIASFLLDDLGLNGFGTNSAGYLGSCCKNAGDVLLTVEDRQMAMNALLGLDKERPGRISAAAGPLAEARDWRKMERARLTGAAQSPNGGYLTGCGCPRSKITVRSDGTIVPCSMLAHMALGRINRDSLQEIWLRSPELNTLRMRHRVPLSDFEFCQGCPYIAYCTGNCPGAAFSITGQVNHPDPDSCLRKFLAEGGSVP
ncbi:Coenzyme PQQ synthesis protein E [uncultured archaeon]|nr:Coenzyme PQQ synthesis protein E [uncultured archaeon]